MSHMPGRCETLVTHVYENGQLEGENCPPPHTHTHTNVDLPTPLAIYTCLHESQNMFMRFPFGGQRNSIMLSRFATLFPYLM